MYNPASLFFTSPNLLYLLFNFCTRKLPCLVSLLALVNKSTRLIYFIILFWRNLVLKLKIISTKMSSLCKNLDTKAALSCVKHERTSVIEIPYFSTWLESNTTISDTVLDLQRASLYEFLWLSIHLETNYIVNFLVL